MLNKIKETASLEHKLLVKLPIVAAQIPIKFVLQSTPLCSSFGCHQRLDSVERTQNFSLKTFASQSRQLIALAPPLCSPATLAVAAHVWGIV